MATSKEISKEIRFAGRRCITNDPTRYPQAEGKANAFATGIGPFSGVGYVLMRRVDLFDLDAGAEHSLTFSTSEGGASQTMTFSRLVIDKAVKVGGGADNDDDAGFLVRLVDRRWHLCRFSATFRQFNVRSWSGGAPLYFDEKYLRETIKAPETPWKNSEIVEFLWSDCGFAGALPAFPVDAFGRPLIDAVAPVENLHFNGKNAWIALHDVLHQIGWTTALDHETGDFSFVQLGGDQDLSALSNNRVVYNAERFSGGTTYAPETIVVAFPIHYDDYGSERDTEVGGNFVTSFSAFQFSIPTGASQAVAGSRMVVWDSTRAVRRHGSWMIDNAAELFDRSLAITLGYLGNNAQGTIQSSGDRAHTLFSGVEPEARLGSKIKALIVRDYGRDPTKGMGDGLVVELLRHPGTPLGEAMLAERDGGCGERTFIGLGFEFSDRTIIEHQDGLDYARPTFPNYPRLPNVVKLTKFKTDDSCCVETESGDERIWAIPYDPIKRLFGGVVHRYDAASGFESLEECWLYFPNHPSDVFRIEPNAFYYARLSGQETSIVDGRKLPLYVATSHVRVLPSWSNECLYLPDGTNGEEFTHGFGACDVKTIAVDATTSLALYRRTLPDGDGEEDSADKCKPSVAIAIKGSDCPEAVFFTPADSKVPKWTVSPKMKTAKFKSGIEIGDADVDGGASVWLLPGGASQKIKIPDNVPASIDRHIFASAVDGECIQTSWGDRGVTADHEFVENVSISYSGGTVWLYGDCGCYLYQDPLTISLLVEKCPIETSRGIVVQLCDETPSGDSPSVVCDVKHCRPLDPCDPPTASSDGSLTCCEDPTSSTEDESPDLLPPIETGEGTDVLPPI